MNSTVIIIAVVFGVCFCSVVLGLAMWYFMEQGGSPAPASGVTPPSGIPPSRTPSSGTPPSSTSSSGTPPSSTTPLGNFSSGPLIQGFVENASKKFDSTTVNDIVSSSLQWPDKTKMDCSQVCLGVPNCVGFKVNFPDIPQVSGLGQPEGYCHIYSQKGSSPVSLVEDSDETVYTKLVTPSGSPQTSSPPPSSIASFTKQPNENE